jgi:ssDNA-specific exonuclease RecJ
MTTITLSYTENNNFVKNMLRTLRSSEYFKVGKPKHENPSPSGDTYFDNPKNIEELERRITDKTPGKTYTIEQLEELLKL